MWIYLAETASLLPPASVVHMCLVLLILLPSYTRLDRPLNRPRRSSTPDVAPGAPHVQPSIMSRKCYATRLSIQSLCVRPRSALSAFLPVLLYHVAPLLGIDRDVIPGCSCCNGSFFRSAVTFNSIVAVVEKPPD